MYLFYRCMTWCLTPFLPAWLRARVAKGKEDPLRLSERFGLTELARPEGALLWVHAASVGESKMILPMIKIILDTNVNAHVLITTGTVTSARLLENETLPRLLHHYLPFDHPRYVERFLSHWQPNLALWVESEFWPTMLMKAGKLCPMILINGRISERSTGRWLIMRGFARQLMQNFAFATAASQEDAMRLKALGLQDVSAFGNLKFTAPPLSCDEQVLSELQQTIKARPVWLCASTHPGEETQLLEVHQMLASSVPQLLTIIVPRHAARGDAIADALKAAGLNVAQRSRQQAMTLETDIYLADTMGELGLFYRLATWVFIGGSLVPHGGQNPFEAARLGAAVLYGPSMHNFKEFSDILTEHQAAIRVKNVPELAEALLTLWRQPERAEALALAANAAMQSLADVETLTWQKLQPYCAKYLELSTHASEGNR